MKKILIMGLPGSGKTTLASELVLLIKAKWINNDKVRRAANDWDFSEEGRSRQAKRMADLAEKEKQENVDRIAYKEGAIQVLEKLVAHNKQLFLVTNAHRKTLDIKLKKFDISEYFSQMICSHELGYIKENIQFWHILRVKLNIDLKNTILIEDTIDNINSAYHAGLRNFVYITDQEKSNGKINPLCLKTFSELTSCF